MQLYTTPPQPRGEVVVVWDYTLLYYTLYKLYKVYSSVLNAKQVLYYSRCFILYTYSRSFILYTYSRFVHKYRYVRQHTHL